MSHRNKREGRAAAIALSLLAIAIAGATVPAIAAAPAEPKAMRPDDVKLSFDVVNGRWNFVGRNVTLKDAVREISAKAPVEVRIQDPALANHKLGTAFTQFDPKEGMATVLRDFNYVQLDDAKSGRRVYVVTSLATETKPVAEERKTVAAAAPAKPAASTGPTKAAKTLNEFRSVEPAHIKSREQSQAEIDADYKREREEKLQRAMDALKSKDVSGAVQAQALSELAAMGDPRATEVLRSTWEQVQGMPNVAPQVAKSVWQNAAQMQFANPDANALLATLATSSNPAVRAVAQAGTQDMQRYLAAQKPR